MVDINIINYIIIVKLLFTNYDRYHRTSPRTHQQLQNPASEGTVVSGRKRRRFQYPQEDTEGRVQRHLQRGHRMSQCPAQRFLTMPVDQQRL